MKEGRGPDRSRSDLSGGVDTRAWVVSWVEASGESRSVVFGREREAWVRFCEIRRAMFFCGDSEVTIFAPGYRRVLTVVQGVAQASRLMMTEGESDGQEEGVASEAVGDRGER